MKEDLNKLVELELKESDETVLQSLERALKSIGLEVDIVGDYITISDRSGNELLYLKILKQSEK